MPLNGDKILGDLNKQLQIAIDKMTELLKLQNKYNAAISGAKDVKTLNDQTEKLNENTHQLTEENKKLIKIQSQINSLSTKDGKKVVKSQVELREARKQARIEAEKELGITKNQTSFTKKLGKAFEFAAAKVLIIFGLFKGLIGILSKNQKIADAFARVMAQLQAIIGVLSGRLANLSKGFKGMGDQIRNAMKRAREIKILEQSLRDLELQLKSVNENAKLGADLWSTLADDATLSFKARRDAQKKAFEDTRQALESEIKLANDALIIAQKKNFEAIKLGQGQLDAQKELTDAQVEYNQKVNELARILIENDKLSRELKQDELERNLDFLIDLFDNQKTINEKIIQSDKLTFDEKQKLLDDTIRLSDISYQEQIKIIEQFAGRAINFNELIEESNAKVQQEKIRQLELSEVIEGRVLEIIKERRLAIQDLAEIQSQLTQQYVDEEIAALDEIIEADNEAVDKRIENARKEQDEKSRLTEREKQEREAAINYISDLAFNAFDLAIALNNREEILTARKYDAEITAAEKAGQSTEELEKKKAIEIAKIQRKQAILNKAAALTDIVINTAIAATKVTAQTGIGAALAIPLVIASGALQAAAVIAQPLPEIPSFFKGVKDFKGGAAELHGGEVVKTEKGDYYTDWGKYEGKLIDLPKHSEVIPNEIVKRDFYNLKKESDIISLHGGISKEEYERIQEKSTKEIINAIHSKPELNITGKGMSIITRKGISRNERIIRRYIA